MAEELDAKFKKAAEEVKTLATQPVQADLLELYSLYKQGTVGDNDTPKPTSITDFKGKAKWNAWNTKKGISQDEAKTLYIQKVEELMTPN